MALVWRDPMSVFRPSRWFGWDPEETWGAVVLRELRDWERQLSSQLSQLDSGAQVTFDKNKFNVNVDVQQFKPNDISVKVSSEDNTITVEGKHEERRNEHGYISKQFVRRYVLPKDHEISKVESKLSSDGVLSITTPKVGDPQIQEKQISIIHTRQPSKAIKNTLEEKK